MPGCVESVSEEQSEAIAQAVIAIHERITRGGKLILFGNGGSATDANDFAIDCMLPPARLPSASLPFRCRSSPPT